MLTGGQPHRYLRWQVSRQVMYRRIALAFLPVQPHPPVAPGKPRSGGRRTGRRIQRGPVRGLHPSAAGTDLTGKSPFSRTVRRMNCSRHLRLPR
jgi:hypothetical protein